MLNNVKDLGGVAILQIATHRLTAKALAPLMAARTQMLQRGRHAMLIDLSKVRHLTHSGLGALVEFTATFGIGRPLAFCSAPPTVAARINAYGAGNLLPYFKSQDSAMNSPMFSSLRLSGTKALVLCAGKGTRMSPLTQQHPKPMLPLFGTPVLEHLLRYLSRYGIDDILLNPGYLGHQVLNCKTATHSQRLHFFNEGHSTPSGWCADPIGSASTLARLHHRHNIFTDDTIVLCGDALIDLDLAAMMADHRASGADVTIAARRIPQRDCPKYGILHTDQHGRIQTFQEKPSATDALSNLASTGIYIFGPSALNALEDQPNQDIAIHLLPDLLRRGGQIQAYENDFEWVDMGCPRDYVAAHFAALQGQIRTLRPSGTETAPQQWHDLGVQISRKAQISGPCYIGPGSVIGPGVEVQGPCVIGPNCHIEGPSLITDSFLMPNTHVKSGAWIAGQLAGPDWAIAHAHADGTLTQLSHTPLDRVSAHSPAEHRLRLPQFNGARA